MPPPLLCIPELSRNTSERRMMSPVAKMKKSMSPTVKPFCSLVSGMRSIPDFVSSPCFDDQRKVLSKAATKRGMEMIQAIGLTGQEDRTLLVVLNHTFDGCKYEEQILLGKVEDDTCKMRHERLRGLRSNFRGVSIHPALQKWRARIKFDKTCKHLGYCTSDVVASVIYNLANIRVSYIGHDVPSIHLEQIAREVFPGESVVFSVTDVFKKQLLYSSQTTMTPRPCTVHQPIQARSVVPKLLFKSSNPKVKRELSFETNRVLPKCFSFSEYGSSNSSFVPEFDLLEDDDLISDILVDSFTSDLYSVEHSNQEIFDIIRKVEDKNAQKSLVERRHSEMNFSNIVDNSPLKRYSSN